MNPEMGQNPAQQPDVPHTPRPRQPGLMQNLGAFFGHILKGAKTHVQDPSAPVEVSRQVREESKSTPQGQVVYRETVIREVLVKPDSGPPGTQNPPTN